MGIEQETEIWPYLPMVHEQLRIHLEQWDIKFSMILRYKEIT